jgi:hypothetical protein
VSGLRENPRLVSCDTTEPEARGAVAAAYQRADEPPGTFWFDTEGDLNGVEPDEERVRAAAERAIANLIRTDPAVAAQLKNYGYDTDALNAAAFMQGVTALRATTLCVTAWPSRSLAIPSQRKP